MSRVDWIVVGVMAGFAITTFAYGLTEVTVGEDGKHSVRRRRKQKLGKRR